MHASAIVLAGLLSAAEPDAVTTEPTTIDLAGASIQYLKVASDLEGFAARELARYFRLMTRKESRLTPTGLGERPESVLASKVQVLVGTRTSLPSFAEFIPESLGEEGYVLRVLEKDPARLLVGARTPAGVQRGVYALLGKLGVGFYLGGDALPEVRATLLIPADLNETREPVFRIRGSLPWYNFLNSPTTWDLEDFQVFFDQMAKMGNNFVGFHSYDSEPFGAYPWKGEWKLGEAAATSLDYGWGTVRGLKSDAFGFGTGRYFPYEVFGSRSSALAKEPPQGSGVAVPSLFPRRTVRDEAILRAQASLAQGLQYAQFRGIHVCVGFELTGDPTREENRLGTEARIRNLLATYPMIDHVWFWQSEGLGGGSAAASLDSPMDSIVQRLRPSFAYLASEERIGEAARVAAWVEFAHGLVKRLRPELRVIVSGWGGDAWMRFSDFYVGLDEVLPKDIVFAALDNIDPTAQTHVSEAYGKLSPEREKWPIPWFESDGGGTRRDQWFSQANVKPFTHLVRDARAKGCQGLLGIHWQTRGIEEVAAYVAEFAWNPDLSYEDFYADFARKCFGDKHAEEMAAILVRLEALGPRWTGGPGQIECGGFQWFSDDRRPREENLKALGEIDAALTRIAPDFAEGPGLRHAERLRYLRAGVAFALRFDRAAVELTAGGRIANLVDAARAAKQEGKADESKRLAAEALESLAASPLGEAMELYTARLTSQGDFGNLATINVKAYAAFLALWERAVAVLGEDRPVPAPSRKLEGPELVVKLPPSALPAGAPFTVRAVVFGPCPLREVVIDYRCIADEGRSPRGGWTVKPMVSVGRNLFEAEIPADSIGDRGVEYHVRVVDEAGATAVAPVGYPEVLYSASALPSVRPMAHGPWLHRDWAFAPWSPAGEEAGPAFLRSVVVPAVEYDACEWQVVIGGAPRGGAAAYTLGAIPVEVRGPALSIASWQANDAQGGIFEGDAVVLAPLAPPLPPASVRVEAVEPFHVRVTWTSPPAAHFEIHRSEQAGFTPGAETLLARWPWLVFDDTTLGPGKSYEYAVIALDDAGSRSPAVRSAVLHVEDAPLPLAPRNVKASPGLGRVTLNWDRSESPVRGYSVFVLVGGSERCLSGETPVKGTEHTVVTEDTAPRAYAIRALDRAKRLGAASEPISAAALPVPHEPVFVARFDGLRASTAQEGKLAGKARIADGSLDVREGGWIAFPREELLQAGAPLTVSLRLNIDKIEGIPVLISFGHWEGPGWWIQIMGGQLRFYLSSQKILDAGSLSTGGWHHVAATYDGTTSRLFVDGAEVGAKAVGPVDPTPWPGELRIGMYSDDAAMFQTLGRFDEVKIWRRALGAAELRGEAVGAK